MLASLGFLLAGAFGPVVLAVEERLELPAEESVALVEALARELRAREAQAVVAPAGLACGPADRCLGALKAATGAEDFLLLRVIGGPKRIRLIAERLRPGAASIRVELSLPREPAEWSGPLREAAAGLFPLLAPTTTTPASPPLEASRSSSFGRHAATWSLLLGGLALAGGGVAFALDRSSARRALDGGLETDAEFESDLTRSSRSGALAGLLLPLGVVALVGGLSLLVVP